MDYKEFKEHITANTKDSILEEIASGRMSMEEPPGFDLSQVMDFDKAKDHIICRLINAENNEQLLADKPHTEKDDFAVTYHVMLGCAESGSYTVPIHNKMLEAYGVSVEELHETAMENMDRLLPVRFTGMNEVLKEMMLPDIMKLHDVDAEDAKEIISAMLPSDMEKMYCLTNSEKFHGAAAILNQEVLDGIAEQLGGDFYILPSSVHETLIIPKEAGIEYGELETMVREVNVTQVAPDERLSNHVYEYDSLAHEVIRSDVAEERKAMREAEKEKAGVTEEKKSLRSRLSEKKTEVSNAVQSHGKEHGHRREEAMA